MLFFKRKKTRKNKSVLAQQRLRKYSVIYFVLPIIFMTGVWLFFQKYIPLETIQIISVSDPHNLLSENEILNITDSPRESARSALLSIGSRGLYSKVQAYKVAATKLQVAVIKRKFILKTKINGQDFYIDKAGNVVRISGALMGELKEVTGLFDHQNKTLEFDNLSALILTKDDRKNLGTLVELEETLTKNQFKFQKLGFLRFRGATALLDEPLEIVFGHGPFEKKMLKLKDILKQTKMSEKHLTRIELDFLGKAFVKEAAW